MVRQATKDDIPQVLELIHEFQKEALNEYSLFCNDEKALKLMEAVYENALVMEIDGVVVGVIAGMIGASMVSTDPCMQELIYYIRKDCRGYGTELLRKFERFSKDRGCKHLLMVHMGNLHKEVMERFYTRRGYKLLEQQFIKQLG